MSKSKGYNDGKHFEWDFDDTTGELRIKCVQCDKIDILTGDKAMKFNNMASAQNYTCLSCWVKNKEAQKQEIQNETQDRIAYAQAWNLAVATLPEKWKEDIGMEETQAVLKERQKWFYKQLTKKN